MQWLLGTQFRTYMVEKLLDLSAYETTSRLWLLASRILPLQARKENFEPSFEDLKRDYRLDLRTFKSKWERRWLMFCFHVNAARLIAESLRVWFWAKILLALKLVWEFVIGG